MTASLLDSIELPEGLEISYDYEDVNVDAVNDTPPDVLSNGERENDIG